MAYTVLARRYRSGTFDEVVGQNHVAQTLKKAIESGRIAHAYLFCGTRGTGKTSTARILAKALNCEKSDGPTAYPCGQCESCKGVARGDDIDVIEIDAASNTGVENIRELIENSQYRPARSRFKIYIIDEVHMLSKNAFNALLKTLEEPPSHVKFILATTEPEKVLATILSRCQRYDFRNIPTREIAAHLASIARQEKIDADADALLLVAKAGVGSMRDSLSLLDRVLSLGEKHITLTMIEELLGLPRSQLIFDLAAAIGSGNVKSVLQQADAIVQSGLSVDGLLAALVDHLRNLLILNSCGADSELVEVPGLTMAELAKQAQQFEAVTLAQDIAVLEELRRQARQSQAGRALLDATLVRLALAEQFSSVADLMARLDGAPATAVQKKKREGVEGSGVRVQGSGSGASGAMDSDSLSPVPGGEGRGEGVLHGKTTPPHPNPLPPEYRGEREPERPAASAVPPASGLEVMDFDDDADDALPAVGRVWDDGPKRSLSSIMAESRQLATQAAPASQPSTLASNPASNVEPVDPANLPGTWQALLELIAKHGPSLRGLLSSGRFVGIEDGRAIVRYPKSQEHVLKMLDRNGKREQVSEAFTQVLNQPLGVRFEIDAAPEAAPTEAPVATPTPTLNRPAPARAAPPPAPEIPAAPTIRLTAELKAELEADPLIRAVMEELGGNIVKVE